ncbi:SubName: Full=Related to copper transporter {ECO:0000313/EMBL:CCA71823.1} [Serendipita indica DSM 11827]|uniref:Copper transport protein n=1 Tax=Serendipita indica (strain DSM 11827) TaxID=1109443 RepID=G4TKI0_SERID|nr:SubName: Full=Related to copper transporter {ECO:0000313/EMBL:CCA71823.1} [Serendipita indica DSM 11827]CCA71823.1 related to copper transporter [Serendipita indica DSM 11827]
MLTLPLLVLALTAQHAAAQHDHGPTSGSSDSSMVMMVPWLHFTPGDTLLFKNWIPRKPGAIFGACIGLFMLAILDRWLAAMRRLMELWWAQRARSAITRRFVELSDKSRSEEEKLGEINIRPASGSKRQTQPTARFSREAIPPFILSHDLARGAFVVCQTAITYALMLTVMTFNASFILSILLGLGTGEVLFGRLAYASAHVDH